jgi:hypothetical protein
VCWDWRGRGEEVDLERWSFGFARFGGCGFVFIWTEEKGGEEVRGREEKSGTAGRGKMG